MDGSRSVRVPFYAGAVPMSKAEVSADSTNLIPRIQTLAAARHFLDRGLNAGRAEIGGQRSDRLGAITQSIECSVLMLMSTCMRHSVACHNLDYTTMVGDAIDQKQRAVRFSYRSRNT